MSSVFLTAEWRKLIMANYRVDPNLLKSYLPIGAELDLRDGICYVSLVGFMFLNTRVKGIRFPFHADFEEVNLRFYVRFQENGEWKRGTVFIKEIVPRYMIALTANLIYKEHYAALPMRHQHQVDIDQLRIRYDWKHGDWNSIRVVAGTQLLDMEPGSEAEFIAEHYYGLSQASTTTTNVYEVEHPRWQMYPVRDWKIEADFGKNYGATFDFLSREKPASVFLMEGSEVRVKDRRRLII
jgi:uncharacterized protein YqjF (DUF2071 family)